MRVTFLGTGAAGGVPLYGCDCAACQRAHAHPAFVRRPCSALIETTSTRVLLDAGLPDLHTRFAPGSLSAIVLTHYHPDHVQGLLHLRWGVGLKIPVIGPHDAEGCADLYKHPGVLDFQTADKFEPFEIGDLRFTPLPLIHSKPTFGYAVEDAHGHRFAYLTDTQGLPPKTMDWLQQWGRFEVALDCSFPPRPQARGHNDWPQAVSLVQELAAARGWLTHIGHELDAWHMATAAHLPAHIQIARDGLQRLVDDVAP